MRHNALKLWVCKDKALMRTTFVSYWHIPYHQTIDYHEINKPISPIRYHFLYIAFFLNEPRIFLSLSALSTAPIKFSLVNHCEPLQFETLQNVIQLSFFWGPIQILPKLKWKRQSDYHSTDQTLPCEGDHTSSSLFHIGSILSDSQPWDPNLCDLIELYHRQESYIFHIGSQTNELKFNGCPCTIPSFLLDCFQYSRR